MKIKKVLTLLLMVVALVSCSSTQSLQEYYVASANNPNFLSIDLPASLLNLDKVDLPADEKESIDSFRKLNILAFKRKQDNDAEFQLEKKKVKAILQNSKFTELMKMNTGFGKASIKYLGDEDAIDEVVVYGDNDEKGFLLVRILGDNMNPAKLVLFIQALKDSDFKGEELGQIAELFKN